VQSVRPIIENTALGLTRYVDPNVRPQDRTLTASIQAEAIEEASATTEDDLDALRQMQPPEGLEPTHELLIAAYAQAIPVYNDVVEAFDSG
jgi:hypothetical protein